MKTPSILLFVTAIFFSMIQVSYAGITLTEIKLPNSIEPGSTLYLGKDQVTKLRKRAGAGPEKKLIVGFKKFVKRQWAKAQKKGQDDLKSRVAKAAGLLALIGESSDLPNSTSYEEVVLNCLSNADNRKPRALMPSKGDINVLQDSGRLQSFAEAYDMIREKKLDPGAKKKAEDKLANWAESMRRDVNLVGAFGVPGHRDNWGIKGGCSLITVALTLPHHEKAGAWLKFGFTLVNDSLNRVSSEWGWYGEGPHYLNYSMNNLAPVAYQVRNRCKVNWFKDLKSLITTSLAMRQPDGISMPFEEGIPVAFPFDVLAPAYPKLGPVLLWAWENSTKATSNFEVQQYHGVTRFIIGDPGLKSRAPKAPYTRFIKGDVHAHVLRSSWQKDAQQLTMLTARDFQSRTMTASRHNHQNPLDLTLFANGQPLLVTSGGGPLVTRSKRRSYYIRPASKNVPLVNGQAPFITDFSRIHSEYYLDSRDSNKRQHRFLDGAKTTVKNYGDAKEMSRSVAMIDDSIFVVIDRMRANAPQELTTPWRGNGSLEVKQNSEHFVSGKWSCNKVPLFAHWTSIQDLSAKKTPAFYAHRWNKEQTIDSLTIQSKAKSVNILGVFQSTQQTALEWKVLRGQGAALESVDSKRQAIELLAGDSGQLLEFGKRQFNGELAVLRRNKRGLISFGFLGVTEYKDKSQMTLKASQALSLSVSFEKKWLVLTVSPSSDGPWSLELKQLPKISRSLRYKASFNDKPLTGAQFKKKGNSLFLTKLQGKGVVYVSP
ncbi:MAG: heparinase II/III family protein [Planctomycetota bacterium]|nr:heparinase II/III family protein [Planctomycetota bacterium]